QNWRCCGQRLLEGAAWQAAGVPRRHPAAVMSGFRECARVRCALDELMNLPKREGRMAKFYTSLNESLRSFVRAQRIFFHASAPAQCRCNLSPKGQDTFRILDDQRVAYLDLTGSECETAAHIAENGRLTIMFCSFDEKPMILRLYGKGSVVHPRDP